MRRWATTLSTLWVFFEMAIVCMFGVALVGLVILGTWPFDRQRRLSGRLYRRVADTVVRLAPQWRLRQVGALPERRPGCTVVICNHRSHLDAFFLARLPWEMKWVGKASLFKIPFIGWGMGWVGDIKLVRGDPASSAAAMQRCQAYLTAGMPIFMFPEGTRGDGRQLLPFKSGAFRLAIAAQAEILPVAIVGTERGLAKYDWRLYPADVALKVGKPLSTAGLRPADLPDLMARARAAIEALVAELEGAIAFGK